METFLSVIHILVAVFLIFLVLIQDSKGGGLGMMGGGSSSSVLGAAGADNIIAKMTRLVALIFAGTSIALSIWSASGSKSVLENAPVLPSNNTQEVAPPVDGDAPATETPETSSN